MPVERRGQVTGVGIDRSTGNGRNRLVLAEGGSLHSVARAGWIERFTSGSVRGSGCNSPGLLGNRIGCSRLRCRRWRDSRPRRRWLAGVYWRSCHFQIAATAKPRRLSGIADEFSVQKCITHSGRVRRHK